MAVYKFDKILGIEVPASDELVTYLNDLIKKYKFPPVELQLNNGIVSISGDLPDQSTLERLALLLGNVVGVCEVNADNIHLEKNVVPTKVTRFYQVIRGDSLWKIAEKIYGPTHGDKYKIILEANKPFMTHADDIFPGQIIRIPNIDIV